MEPKFNHDLLASDHVKFIRVFEHACVSICRHSRVSICQDVDDVVDALFLLVEGLEDLLLVLESVNLLELLGQLDKLSDIGVAIVLLQDTKESSVFVILEEDGCRIQDQTILGEYAELHLLNCGDVCELEDTFDLAYYLAHVPDLLLESLILLA